MGCTKQQGVSVMMSLLAILYLGGIALIVVWTIRMVRSYNHFNTMVKQQNVVRHIHG